MEIPAVPAATVLAWACEFLPDYFTDAPAPFHAELLADLERPSRRLIARVAPRGHAKSTCVALAYPLWCVCERRRRNIVIITHESSLATQFVSDIRRELDTNEQLLAAYGDLCRAAEPEPLPTRRKPRRRAHNAWSQGRFVTASGTCVQAKGCGASFRGTRSGPYRPDLIICDDIEKDERVRSPEQRRKLEHWLRRVVMPALAPGGQLVVLGSILHFDSLLANLSDRQRWPRWDYRVYRAIECPPGADGVFRPTPLWPARWPLARLDEERERVGSLAFEQEYLANPIDDSRRIFRPEWLRRYAPGDLAGRDLVNLLAVDPATGKADGDYFALWVGSLDSATGVLYTRALTLERVGIVEQVRRVVAAAQRWRPTRIGIETVAYQVALKEILEEESRRLGLYLPVVALETIRNKRARIDGSSLFFEKGLFLLPPDLDPEAERQFLQFPRARHDDAPDVCAMGIALAREMLASGVVAGWTEEVSAADAAEW